MNIEFSPDSPIKSRNEDSLGRTRFAENIARALNAHRPSEANGVKENEGAFAVALCGDWGSGKTSVKNIILETLRELPTEEQPRIVEFNPWEWSNSGQLTEEFFEALADTLGHNDKHSKNQKLIRKFKQYSARLKLHSTTGDGTQKLLTWVLAANGLTALIGWRVPESYKGILGFVALVFGVLVVLLQWSGDFAEKWVQTLETQEKTSPSALKSQLSKEIQKLPNPVLVVMDDIDRLSAEEIPHLFQLVKANANFPNIIYLLLFDRTIVERALERVAPKLPRHAGREYLEKIIQVAFDLPTIAEDKIGRFVCDELTRVAGIAPNANLNQRRWSKLWVEGLSPFFASLRDASRFLNSFGFHIQLLMRDEELEADPADIVAIEVIRVFEPDVYRSLPALKEILIRDFERISYIAGAQDSQRATREQENRRRALEFTIRKAHPERRDAIRSTLRLLFPVVDNLLRAENEWPAEDGDTREAHLNFRICHTSCFDRYFQLALDDNKITRAEIKRILSLANNETALLEALTGHKERDTLSDLLRSLGIFYDQFPQLDIVPFLSALMRTCDVLPYEPISPSVPMWGLEFTVHGLMRDALEQLPERAERSRQIKLTIERTTAFYLPAYFIGREIRLLEEYKEKESWKIERECTVVDEDIPNIKRLCVEKIRIAAADGRLATHRELSLLLQTWRLWMNPNDTNSTATNNTPEEIRIWVQKLIETDEGLLSFLRGFLRSSAGGAAGEMEEWKTLWNISLSSLEYFVSQLDLSNAVARLERNKVNGSFDEYDLKPLEIYKLALKRGAEGKSEDDFWGLELIRR